MKYNIWDISDKWIILKESQITKLQAIDIISMKECSKCYAKGIVDDDVDMQINENG